jgi:glyoxylase-like metal-dependent hydrolase (beta-lactamase superfamily II)
MAPFMGPEQVGHTSLLGPSIAFLIHHSSTNTRFLFDLGCRKDWENLPPAVLNILAGPGWNIEVTKDVGEILTESGIDVQAGAIDSIIWSHWHYDHTGDPSKFPASTSLIVGPGFKDAFIPAQSYPSNPNGVVLESDFTGREVREISFDQSVDISGFKAFDFFNDGSFYLLDAPGHTVGHLCGLARVSIEPSTFVFMGGDAAHHGAEYRPTEYLPLPKQISPSPLMAHKHKHVSFCPGEIFASIHATTERYATEPLYRVSEGVAHDWKAADQTIRDMMLFDADENVFVVIAHDASLLLEEVGMTWFPEGGLGDWKKKGWKEKERWGFLKDFEPALVGKSVVL